MEYDAPWVGSFDRRGIGMIAGKRSVGVAAAVGLALALSPIGQAGAGKRQKFAVNHKGKVICVSENALQAHFNHGDSPVVAPC
jgi:hypothetical protein